MYTKRIKLGITPGEDPKVIHVSQYDAGSRTIELELFTEENTEMTIPSSATAVVNGTKPDGNAFSYDATLSEGVATVVITEQMAAVAGKVPCKLVISSGSEKLLTEKFILEVDRAAMDKDTVSSDSELREFAEIMADPSVVVEAANRVTQAKEAAEAAAAAAIGTKESVDTAEGRIEAAKDEIEDIKGQIEEDKSDIDEALQDLSESKEGALRSILEAKENAVGVIEDKAANVAQMKSNAETVAAQALAKANNLDNAFADVEASANQLKSAVTNMQLLLSQKVDGGYADPQGYLHLTSNGDDVGGKIGPFASSGGGGGSSGGNNAVFDARNATGWISKTIASGDSCEIKIEWSSTEEDLPTGNGVLKVYVGGNVKASLEVAQGIITTDVSKYLATGSNLISFNISDTYGNNRTFNVTVTVEVLSLTSPFDASTQYDSTILFPYIPKGSVSKTMYFYLDGNLLGTYETSVSGRQLTYTIPQQSHGSHTLRCYFECEINGQTVKSNELYYEITCIDPLSDETIIASSFDTTEVQQFTTIQLSYSVYNPAGLTAEVQIYANDVLLTSQTVDRTEQNYSYRADAVGELELKIVSGTTEKSWDITVTESEIDVEAETEALTLYLSSKGRSNNEANPGTWEYEDISAQFAGFNFVSDGWQTDSDGITVLRVSGDARLTIPYKPFASDFRATGKTIELEFATRNVLDYDAVILSCMSGGRGISLTAQAAVMASEQSTIRTQYKEDEHVRLSFVIEKRAENRLILIYINGIPSGVVQYPADDDFSQVDPVNISIGNNDCTIDLYCIRVYDQDLTRHQALENWIADTQIGAVMLERYKRNKVYDSYGEIVISQLPSDLPYMILDADELPQYKGDKKKISGSFTDPLNPGRSFDFTGCEIDVQGTSSAPYARKNYDMKFKGGFNMATGKVNNYELYTGAIPFNRFVMKADVASSEGANNVELVKLYNDICPYKTQEMEADERVRWGIYGFPIVIFWHDTVSDTTNFLGKYNFNFPKRAPEPYGYSGDMESWEFQNNTSDMMLFKGSDFDSDYTDPETGETYKAWKNDFEARFPSDEWEDITILKEFVDFVVSTNRADATNDPLDEAAEYGGVEYTIDSAEYRLAKFKEEFPTYAELNTFLFYYIFTELFLMVDSRAKNLFVGFNGSPVTAEGRAATRKATAQPYDMDTGLGTNNEGSLVFGYGLEDTDYLTGGANIFNGQDSVLWCNLRDSYRAEIVSMYKTLRSSGGLSYSNTEARYESHQEKWPEAVWIEDAWFKYIDPLIDPDEGKEATAVYLPMMQGSKAEQRKWWLSNRFKYMDSKWNAGDALSQVIQLRGYAKADITVTPYTDIYPTVKYASYLVQARGTRRTPTTLACPLDAVNDTEIYIYSAPQLASVGDLSGLKVGFADFSMGTRLQDIKIGDAAQGYDNPNLKTLTLGSNVLLKSLDVRNCSALGTADQKTVDLSGCEIIENVYFDGTAVTGVALPNGGNVKILHLPATITNLTLMNQKNITDLTVASYDNVTTLRIENSSVDTKTILQAVPASSRVRLIGISWEVANAAEIDGLYDILDTMRGLDESGNNTERAQVSGTIHLESMTGAEMAELSARYPYVTINADHTTSYLTYMSYDGGTELKKVACYDGIPQNSAPSIPSRTSTAQYDYSAVGWSASQDAQTADYSAAGPTTGVQADTTLYAAYSRTLRTYTVTWKNSDGTTLETDTNVPYGSTPHYDGSTPQNPTSGGGAFQGWTPAISSVSGNITYTASYIVTYTVYFYNGSTLLQTVQNVAEGGSATYTGATPTKTDVENPDDYDFTGWSPTPTNIRANTSCYAQFSFSGVEETITDTWEQIIAAVNNGTYKNRYQVGDTKKISLGSEGAVAMQIVAFDTDDLADGNGKAPITFISKQILKTDHRMNPSRSGSSGAYDEGTGTIGGWEKCEMRSYLKETIKPLIPSTVSSAIKEVTKYSRIYNPAGNAVDNVASTEDVWIPSRKEMNFDTSYESNCPVYDSAFPDNASRIKMKTGATSAAWWWLRSAYNGSNFGSVYSDGSNRGSYADDSGGVVLGFCL